jgi:GAF domain-containing protein
MTGLSEIDRTPLLARRNGRPADYAAESAVLQRLAAELGNPAGNVLGCLAASALELCGADSAGISLLEPDACDPMFRWHAIRGDWAKYEGGGLPRDGSPCGVTIARNQTCLMTHPERYFPAVAGAEPAIDEVLLTPFLILGEPLATVWVIFHARNDRPQRAFDKEHVRQVESLARFASNAFLLQEQVRNATEARDEALRANRRLMKVLQKLGHVSDDVVL